MNKFTTRKIEVDIKLIEPNPWNPNLQSDFIYQKEIESIKKFGLLGSILVRETAGIYQILDGEHRWKACKELGFTKIQVETIGEIPDEQARTFTILLNNIRGKDNIEKRAELFKQLDEGQLSLLPFTKEEIENEKALFEFDFSQYDKQEKIEQRKTTNTLCFALTENERELWDKAIEEIKKQNSKVNEIEIFLKILKEYLWLTWGISFDKEIIN